MLGTNVETVINNERKIKISSILVHALLRWKIILVISLLAACLGGFREYRSEKQAVENSQTSTAEVNENDYLLTNEQYENLLNEYDKEIANRYAYLDESIYAKTNPYDFCTGYATFYVKSPYINSFISDPEDNFLLDSDDNILMLLTSLNNYVLYGIDLTEIKEKYNISNDAIANELIYGIVENNLLRINTYYNNEDDADYILNYVVENINQKFDSMVQTLGLHNYELVMLDKHTTSKVMTYNYTWYTSKMTEVENLIKSKGNFISNNSVSSTVNNVVYKISKKAVLKKAVIFGFIGLLGALFCVVALLFVSGRVMSYEELKLNYDITNISILNKNWHKKQATGITKKIYALEKEGKSALSDENRLAIADNLIRNLAPEAKTIGLIGDMEPHIASKVRDLLAENKDIEYVYLDTLNDDLSQRKMLEKVDCLILLAENEKSKYSVIEGLLALSKIYNKAIIGSIMC